MASADLSEAGDVSEKTAPTLLVRDTEHDAKWTFALGVTIFIFMLCLGITFEGLFFTENDITIKTDELEEEKREKDISRN